MPGSSDPEDSGESDELVAVAVAGAGGSCVGAFFRRFGAVDDEDEATEDAVALSPAAFFAPAAMAA